MPTVARLSGEIRVLLYYKEHGVPHFHVQHAGLEASIRIADLCVIEGSIRPTDMLIVLHWARFHRDALARNWMLARAGLPLEEIPLS